MPNAPTHVAFVIVSPDSIAITLPILDPKSLREALTAAASAHPWAAQTGLLADTEGGLSANVAFPDGEEIEKAKELAMDSLRANGYEVSEVYL